MIGEPDLEFNGFRELANQSHFACYRPGLKYSLLERSSRQNRFNFHGDSERK